MYVCQYPVDRRSCKKTDRQAPVTSSLDGVGASQLVQAIEKG